MKKISFALFFICIATMVKSQYYYQDIVVAEKTAKNFALLKANGIKKITISSMDADGMETSNFSILQTVQAAKNMITTVTHSNFTGSSTLISFFDSDGRIKETTDSTGSTINNAKYTYTSTGNLLQVAIQSFSLSDTSHYTVTEDHIFEYNSTSGLTGMKLVKNHADTVFVKFLPTDNQLPGEEQWWKQNKKTETWYYYYESKNRLTDIVRYNAQYKTMLPDYIFAYNDAGKLATQTVVQPGTSFYRTWIYQYQPNGLLATESIVKKGNIKEAKIVYHYE